MHALEVELLWARCLLGLGPPGTRTLTSLSPGSRRLAFLQQARESRPSAPSPMSTHLPCFLPLPGSQAPHTSPKTLGTPKLWKRVWLPGTHGEGGKERMSKGPWGELGPPIPGHGESQTDPVHYSQHWPCTNGSWADTQLQLNPPYGSFPDRKRANCNVSPPSGETDGQEEEAGRG